MNHMIHIFFQCENCEMGTATSCVSPADNVIECHAMSM